MIFLIEPNIDEFVCGPTCPNVDPDCCHGGDACPTFY